MPQICRASKTYRFFNNKLNNIESIIKTVQNMFLFFKILTTALFISNLLFSESQRILLPKLELLENQDEELIKQTNWNQKLIDNIPKEDPELLKILINQGKILNELNDSYNEKGSESYLERKSAINLFVRNQKSYDSILKLMIVGTNIKEQLLIPLVNDYQKLKQDKKTRELGASGTILFDNGSLKYSDEDLIYFLKNWIEARIKNNNTGGLFNKIKKPKIPTLFEM